MTLSDAGRDSRQDVESADIEALLPWYAAGTLRRRDRQRVEEALRQDPDLARHARSGPRGACRNHSPQRNARRAVAARGGPADGGDRRRGGRRAQARTGRRRRLADGFFANLSPRTLAVAASFAMLAIALQAVMIVDIFTKPRRLVAASRAWRRAPPRHIRDGALCAAGKRRRNHEFPAKLPGRPGRRPDGRRALSRADRDDDARQRGTRPDHRAHAAGPRRRVRRAGRARQ